MPVAYTLSRVARKLPASNSLSDAEARFLMETGKDFDVRVSLTICPRFAQAFDLRAKGTSVNLVLDMRLTRRENFMFQLRILGLKKGVLARLDTWGPAHPNPDGKSVPTPHLHLYKQGYSDEIAYPINVSDFRDIGDMLTTYEDYCNRFNIKKRPRLIIEGLE